MADNVAITAGTGTTIAADDVGGVLSQRVKVQWGPDGTVNDADVASGKPIPIQVRSATGLIPLGEPTDAKSTATDTTSVTGVSIWKQISASVQSLVTNLGTLTYTSTWLNVLAQPRVLVVTGTVLTAVGGTYAANESISNSTTAGSVTALPFTTVSDTNDAPVTIERIRMLCSSTVMVGKNVELRLFNSDPTANSGVVVGDGSGTASTYSNKQAGLVGRMVGVFVGGLSDGSFCEFVPASGTQIKTLPSSGGKSLWWQIFTVDAITSLTASATFTPVLEGFQSRA